MSTIIHEQKIKSISEAFSMQPVTLSISDQENYDKCAKANLSHAPDLCKEIRHDKIMLDGKLTSFYVGYNFKGEQIFRYLVSAVNVHYVNLTYQL